MEKPGRWLDIAVGLIVLCAVVTTGLVVRRELFSESPRGELRTDREVVGDWRAYAAIGHRAGSADARVTITVFSDFQCPYCRMLARQLDDLRLEHADELVVVFRHLPLPNHPFAAQAARASECAAAQARFWPFHDALFAGQDSIGTVGWERFARAANVPDLDAFERCVAETAPLAVLARDGEAARRLGARGTPTFLVNDRLIRGAVPIDVLRHEVQEVRNR